MFSNQPFESVPKKEVEPYMFVQDSILFGMTHCNIAHITFEEAWRRYPKTGYALNRDSDMIIRVVEGEVFLFSGKSDHPSMLRKGSVVGIPKGEKYYWRQKWINPKRVVVEIFSAPMWTKEQQVLIPE